MHLDQGEYWNELADRYQRETHITCGDFHYGPLLPGDAHFRLLPSALTALRCLELGCGAGQNSIYLAGQGALCTAVDISDRQLELARQTAAAHNVQVNWFQSDMDDLPFSAPQVFDFIHTNSLGFSRAPSSVVARAAGLLAPGGTLLAATNHSAFAGEWLEVDEDEEGMFLSAFHHPPPDRRESATGKGAACCQSHPPSAVFAWFRAAGLEVDTLLEPVAPPLADLAAAPDDSPLPYDSADWRTLLPQLQRFPFMSILRGRRHSDNPLPTRKAPPGTPPRHPPR